MVSVARKSVEGLPFQHFPMTGYHMQNVNQPVHNTVFSGILMVNAFDLIDKRALETSCSIVNNFHDIFSSMYMPTNLVAFSLQSFPILSKQVPFILTHLLCHISSFEVLSLYNFCFALSDNLLEQNHSYRS